MTTERVNAGKSTSPRLLEETFFAHCAMLKLPQIQEVSLSIQPLKMPQTSQIYPN